MGKYRVLLILCDWDHERRVNLHIRVLLGARTCSCVAQWYGSHVKVVWVMVRVAIRRVINVRSCPAVQRSSGLHNCWSAVSQG
jgi:hypothetical protein